jgi:hypothetical protein
MPQSLFCSQQVSGRILAGVEVDKLRENLRPKAPTDKPLPKRLPQCNDAIAEGLARRRAFLTAQGIAAEALYADAGVGPGALKGNTENYVGVCQIPERLVGPLRVNGLSANGGFFVGLSRRWLPVSSAGRTPPAGTSRGYDAGLAGIEVASHFAPAHQANGREDADGQGN